MMNKKVLKKIGNTMIVCIFSIALCACSNVDMQSNQDLTTISRTVEYDKDSKYTEIVNVVTLSEKGKDIADRIEFSNEDSISDINSIKKYFYRDSVYVQSGKYMYRFQLDSEHNIVSYIKYALEG